MVLGATIKERIARKRRKDTKMRPLRTTKWVAPQIVFAEMNAVVIIMT